MQFSRRGMILSGAALSASFVSSSSRSAPFVGPARPARVLLDPPPSLEAAPATAPEAIAAASGPVLDPKGQIRKALLDGALEALKRHDGRITRQDRIYLVDFRAHSSKPRLFSLDLKSGEVEAFHTAHGKGSDPAWTGWAQRFSNTPNSDSSSIGAYVPAGQSAGARDGANVLLEGLDPTNSEARERAIIVHAADYCEPAFLAAHGRLGRSNGCFALSGKDLKALRPAMDEGRLRLAAA